MKALEIQLICVEDCVNMIGKRQISLLYNSIICCRCSALFFSLLFKMLVQYVSLGFATGTKEGGKTCFSFSGMVIWLAEHLQMYITQVTE